MNEFWMVYATGGDKPNKKHETLESAVAEASRIAHKNGDSAFVLRTVKRITPTFDVKTEDL